jgi:hypothetical protein
VLLDTAQTGGQIGPVDEVEWKGLREMPDGRPWTTGFQVIDGRMMAVGTMSPKLLVRFTESQPGLAGISPKLPFGWRPGFAGSWILDTVPLRGRWNSETRF